MRLSVRVCATLRCYVIRQPFYFFYVVILSCFAAGRFVLGALPPNKVRVTNTRAHAHNKVERKGDLETHTNEPLRDRAFEARRRRRRC